MQTTFTMLDFPLNLRVASCQSAIRTLPGASMIALRWMLIVCIFVACIPCLQGAETWRTFTDKRDRKIIAKIIKVNDDSALVELRSNGHQHVIRFDSLSEEDVKYLENYSKDAAGKSSTPDAEQADDEANKRLYPRTKEEIRAGIRAIKGSDPAKGISSKTHEAVIALNIFRFLSGLSHEVDGDATFSQNATDAALACKKNGGLSHDLGDSTNKCNLSSGGDMAQSVSAYIEDGGDNNRELRGHRAWCLNPAMGKVGFGTAGSSYSAMWCMDASGKGKKPDFWAYPGQGFYPQEYVLGNAWTVYFDGNIADLDKVEVEVFRLSKRPEKALPMQGEIDGRSVPILHKSKSMIRGINFEPKDPTQKGIYWVRITGGGARYGYVVEIY